MRLRKAGVLVAVLIGCAAPERHGSATESRIFPPGQGNVVHFDLQSAENSPIYILSKNVQAQRDGSAVVVNFEEIDFSREPREQRDIQLRKLVVRAYRVLGERHEPLGSSDEKELRDLKLTAGHAVAHAESVQLKLPNAATECDTDCLLTVVVDYSAVNAQKSMLGGLFHAEVSQISSAESAPVRIDLGSGMAGSAQTLAAGTDDDALTAVCAPRSQFGPKAASRALGVAMKFYEPQNRDCTMVPVDPAIPFFSMWVIEDAGSFDSTLQNYPGSEAMQIGDRAMWLNQVSSILVQKGEYVIQVEIGGGPSAPKAPMQARALKLAAKILAQL
jgi:hypothetical protein